MAGRPHTLNDEDRASWVDNDEGLYDWWRAWARYSKNRSKMVFIRRNRGAIDVVIDNITSGRQPAHYLKYGRTNG